MNTRNDEIRSAWGERSREELTCIWALTGTDRDRSRYARMWGAMTTRRSRLKQMILFQRLGVDTSVLRQRLQTAVAFMRSRSEPRNAGMRARTSGGRRLIGASEFLSSRRLVEMGGNLDITQSIWAKLDL